MKYLTFFYKTFSKIVDHHARLIKVTKKERTSQSKPWINNKEIKHLMWKRDKLFRKYLKAKSKSKIDPNIVKVKGKDITNPIEIANAFNNFFINTGPNLSKTILDSSKPFKNFLKNSSLNSFLLKATSEDEVHKLISQLSKEEALGPLSIPVVILKDNVNILSTPLSFIINRSFE